MMLPPAPCRSLPCRLLPQMEHAGQVDRDDAIPFSGIAVEKGGGLTNADAVEEHIRNRGIDSKRTGWPVASATGLCQFRTRPVPKGRG